MRVLVTGGDGFVGRHLCAELRARGDEAIVAGHEAPDAVLDLAFDLRDPESVRAMVVAARADAIAHLAAEAFVPAATRDPLRAYDLNALGTARLFEAVRSLARAEKPLVLLVSSGEVYGAASSRTAPLDETVIPQPATPYAASKLAGEAFALASMRCFGTPAIVARAFNHLGPGQDPRFAIAGFARKLAAIAAGEPPVLDVGNLDAQRDYLDVRDVARAYAMLLHAPHLAGETFNVCSGRSRTIGMVLNDLIAVSGISVRLKHDPERMRPSEVPRFLGSSQKLAEATGWSRTIPLAQSLRDIFAAACAPVGATAP